MSDETRHSDATNTGLIGRVAWGFVGTIAGLAVALVLVIAVEVASAIVYPLPPDFAGTHEEMCAHVAGYPQWVLAVVVPLWAFTAWSGAWTAGRLGGRGAAIAVGALFAAAVLWNVAMLPYPVWFKIASPVAVVAAVAAAIRQR